MSEQLFRSVIQVSVLYPRSLSSPCFIPPIPPLRATIARARRDHTTAAAARSHVLSRPLGFGSLGRPEVGGGGERIIESDRQKHPRRERAV